MKLNKIWPHVGSYMMEKGGTFDNGGVITQCVIMDFTSRQPFFRTHHNIQINEEKDAVIFSHFIIMIFSSLHKHKQSRLTSYNSKNNFQYFS